MTREEFLQATGEELINNATTYGKINGIVFADIYVDGELVRIETRSDYADVAEYAKANFNIEPGSLTSTSATSALSANQGRALKEQITQTIDKFGEVARLKVLTQAEFEALTTKDPGTLYLVKEG